VRNRKLFTLEDAVRKMTGIPAQRFGLVDRGEVREGAFADLVVFNPVTVTDRATYDDPHQLSVGIGQVIVNGVPIIAGGLPMEKFGPELPGRALRFKA
jgi:N-acyl-D-aspartate/D-glutamate deacylase